MRDDDQIVTRHQNEKAKSRLLSQIVVYPALKKVLKDKRSLMRWETSRSTKNAFKVIEAEVDRVDHRIEYCERESPLLVVDQLWIGSQTVSKSALNLVCPYQPKLCHIETIITSFPIRRHSKRMNRIEPNDESDILGAILQWLRNPNRRPITQPNDLMEVIVWNCISILSNPEKGLTEIDFMKIFSFCTNEAASRV
jgi:hypothetical protein